MLRHIEKAYLFCNYRDIYIVFDDGKSFPPDDRRINKFTRRNRKAVKATASFAIGVTIGGFTSVVPAINSDFHHVIPLENNMNDVDNLLRAYGDKLLKEAVLDKAEIEPIKLTLNGKTLQEVYWFYQNRFYKDTDGLSHEDVKALLLTRQRMRTARINRAKTISSTPESPGMAIRRGSIPDDVKLLVWQRDGGKCVKCGSRVELQYDHVIPFSLGGSSSQDNLQILCGPCNRSKSNSIV